MCTEDIALLCFTIIFSLVMVALIFSLILECYREKNNKNIKLLFDENEKLKKTCELLTIKCVSLNVDNIKLQEKNKKLNKILSKRK